jgi:peroxiredoxin Q/BCP
MPPYFSSESPMQAQAAPDFDLPATGGKRIRLSDFKGRGVVLYFYPKDNTPGCSTEGQDFRDLFHEFRALGWDVLGVSRDGMKSHEIFKAKLGFPFDLLSDPDETLCEAFGVMKLKNMYGKQVRGIERSTFAIAPDGSIARTWRGVKVPNHAREVLEYVRSLA